MDEFRYWRIQYLPYDQFPGVVEWVFKGKIESELNNYLNTYHSCGCRDCIDSDFWLTPQACEYHIEEITYYND